MGDEVCRQQGGGGNEIKAGAAEYSVILILVLYLTLVLRCEVPSKHVFPSRTTDRSVLQLKSETVAEPQTILSKVVCISYGHVTGATSGQAPEINA